MSNYKQTMKLYTEADLKKVISIYSEEYKTSTDEILKELNITPIELPSDEEVEETAVEFAKKYRATTYELSAFIIGAKMVTNKIQGGNK